MTDYLTIARRALAGMSGSIATAAKISATEETLDPAELARASALLNRAGVRIMALEVGATIGVWSDLDGPEVRAALCTLRLDGQPIRYLDGAGVPMRYKLRRVEGEPVPTNVLAEMEQHPAEPWKVRDRMLNDMGWCSKGTPWAERKAAALNRLFQEQVTSLKPGRITAVTIRHGERKTKGTGTLSEAAASCEERRGKGNATGLHDL